MFNSRKIFGLGVKFRRISGYCVDNRLEGLRFED